jgi:CHAD domain-containing protein
MSVTVGASTLLKRRLDRFTRVLPGVEKGDVRSLHRARVASRRLRELLPILQLESSVSAKLGRRLRKVTRRLGVVRELDVLLFVIEELQSDRPEHRDALRRVHAVVRKAQDEARKRLLAHLPSDEMWRLARKLDRVVGKLKRGEKARRHPSRAKTPAWVIDARIAHRAARLDEAMRDAGNLYLTERLHVVRIAVKKLRYALELSAPATPDRTSALRVLKRAQELLGRMHDLQVLIDRVRGVQASLTPPNLTAWRELDALVIALDESCRRLHARYVRDRGATAAIAVRLSAAPAAAPRREQRAG